MHKYIYVIELIVNVDHDRRFISTFKLGVLINILGVN